MKREKRVRSRKEIYGGEDKTEMQAETKRKHCAKYFLEAYVTKQKQDLLGKGKGAGGNEHAREKDKEEKKLCCGTLYQD